MFSLGGQVLGFNRDRDFNDCLDALIMVDLANTDTRLLQRYLGETATAEFLAFHDARHKYRRAS